MAGGQTFTAYSYVESTRGLVPESSYSYTSGDGVTGDCVPAWLTNPQVAVTGAMTVSAQDPPTREAQMAGWVSASGPLSICVDAHNWQTYDSGVMSADACGTNINHCVQAVGIDTGGGYWKIRNSWGAGWGESGFIRLRYGSNTCGLTDDPTYVAVRSAGPSPPGPSPGPSPGPTPPTPTPPSPPPSSCGTHRGGRVAPSATDPGSLRPAGGTSPAAPPGLGP